MNDSSRFVTSSEWNAAIIRRGDPSEGRGRPSRGQFSPWETPPSQEHFLSILFHVLRQRKWTVIAFFALVVVMVGTVSIFLKPRYEAVARIVFNRETWDPLGFKDVGGTPPEDSDYSVSLDTQVRILESETLALQTIRELHLNTNPKFLEAPTAKEGHANDSGSSGLDPKRREVLLRAFHDSLSVSKDKNTRVIEISYKSKDPQLAADIANAISRTYIEDNFKMRFQATTQTSDWLAQQLAELQTKVAVSQEKLVAYQKEHGILGIDDKQNVITARLDDLNRELTVAQGDRIQNEASYRLTLSSNPELVIKTEPDALIEKLRNQEALLNVQYALATTQLGPSNPKVLEIRNQINETGAQIAAEVARISERIRNRYSGSLEREKMIRAALENQKREANALNQSAIEYSLLKRDLDSNRLLYEGLLQKLKEAGVSAGLRSSNIQIVDVAQTPGTPCEPRIFRNLAVAMLVGLFGGISLAFIQERLDRTVKSLDQVQVLSPLPTLGIIPLGDLKKLTNSVNSSQLNLLSATAVDPAKMIVGAYPTSVQAESYRAVLNSILLAPATPPRTILVTSAVTQEGKTTTSINLAIALARQGRRVLLIDADVHKPSIQETMNLQATSGLSTVIRTVGEVSKVAPGWASAEDAVVPVPDVPNLFVLTAGPPDPAPSELLVSERMRALLAGWSKKYDHVVIDTAPILLAADVVPLSVEADSVILVVRYGYTPREAFARAQALLKLVNAPVTGIVLNGYALDSPELSHYGKYGYGYGANAKTN